MMRSSIYGPYLLSMERIRCFLLQEIERYSQEHEAAFGEKPYDHVLSRIKSEDSMREKLNRKGLEETTDHALHQVMDGIGIQII